MHSGLNSTEEMSALYWFSFVKVPPGQSTSSSASSSAAYGQIYKIKTISGIRKIQYCRDKPLMLFMLGCLHILTCGCHPCTGAMLIFCIVQMLMNDPARESMLMFSLLRSLEAN